MTTVIFVHGTGVREPHYSASFNQIKRKLSDVRPDVKIVPCYWGDPHGAKLHQEGASIPLYDSTRTIGNVAEEDYFITLWDLLYQDPLYELRTLSLESSTDSIFVPGQVSPGEELKTRVRNLPIPLSLQSKLEEGGISDIFTTAKESVSRSAPFLDALRSPSQTLGPYRVAIARAIVAEAIAECKRQGSHAPVATDAILRDDIVQILAEELGSSERGLAGWAGKQLLGLALHMGAMNHIQRRRGTITDASYPAAGDVILYQGRGEAIRTCIRDSIVEVGKSDANIVLLAHSLGGIACVDLLVLEELPVELLVTVGSQAPFLYEIGALHSLAYGEKLPPRFPSWLNIYDLRDFLSYVGAGVFPDRVQDVPVDSKQPFPTAHSAYWDNPATWKAIMSRLP